LHLTHLLIVLYFQCHNILFVRQNLPIPSQTALLLLATSLVRDITTEFNDGSGYVLDTNGWDYVIVQIVTSTGAVSFTATNNGGDVQGSTLGNQYSATNFATIAGQDLAATASTTYITSVAANGLIRFDFPPQFLKLAGSSVTAAKVIVKLHKQY